MNFLYLGEWSIFRKWLVFLIDYNLVLQIGWVLYWYLIIFQGLKITLFYVIYCHFNLTVAIHCCWIILYWLWYYCNILKVVWLDLISIFLYFKVPLNSFGTNEANSRAVFWFLLHQRAFIELFSSTYYRNSFINL